MAPNPAPLLRGVIRPLRATPHRRPQPRAAAITYRASAGRSLNRITTAAKDTMDRCLVSPQTPSKGTETTLWDAAAERLPMDPDFSVAFHAEVA